MAIDNKREKVLNFFNCFIEDFICKDLEVLNSIKPNLQTGLGGCTIPTAMTIISTIELLGFLLKVNGKTGNSKENIYNFILYKKISFFPSGYDQKVAEKIFNYRHGMMHHFFPKFKAQFVGICKNELDDNLFISQQFHGEQLESLNVTTLLKDFLFALENLKLFLKSTSEELVIQTILEGLKNLDYNLELYPTTTTCTTISPGTPQNK